MFFLVRWCRSVACWLFVLLLTSAFQIEHWKEDNCAQHYSSLPQLAFPLPQQPLFKVFRGTPTRNDKRTTSQANKLTNHQPKSQQANKPTNQQTNEPTPTNQHTTPKINTTSSNIQRPTQDKPTTNNQRAYKTVDQPTCTVPDILRQHPKKYSAMTFGVIEKGYSLFVATRGNIYY